MINILKEKGSTDKGKIKLELKNSGKTFTEHGDAKLGLPTSLGDEHIFDYRIIQPLPSFRITMDMRSNHTAVSVGESPRSHDGRPDSNPICLHQHQLCQVIILLVDKLKGGQVSETVHSAPTLSVCHTHRKEV